MNCVRRKEELRTCRRELKESQAESKIKDETAEIQISALRTQLFHCHKEAKKYDKAEDFYHMIVTEQDAEKSEDPAVLDLKYCFAEMLMSQKKFNEAELISRAVWDKRKADSESEESKTSHRQLCSILVSLKKYGEAENMHRTMYHKEPKDSWALENGDAVCWTMSEQGQYDQAQLMQESVWKTRQTADGQRHDLTIRSGLQRVAFLELLVKSNNNPGVSDAERRLSSTRQKGFECELEVMLWSIWTPRVHPEPITGILDAGHKLGTILFSQSKFTDAEAVFLEVWSGRKSKFGEENMNTMATGSMLGKALLRQGRPEAYSRAVTIFHSIWHARQALSKKVDVGTISIGDDLAQAYFLLEDWQQAEITYRWVVEQKARMYDWQAPETVDARWSLGQTLFKQGEDKDREAEEHLGAVYQIWNQISPHAKVTLKCGHMLAELLQPQEGKANDALQVSRDVFIRREVSIERGVDYLDSGRLYGWLLLEGTDFPEAEKVLKTLWGYEAKGPEEERMRLRCGHLLGAALAKQQKCTEAKEVLEVVVRIQGSMFPVGGPEVDEASQLLKEVSDRCREMEKARGVKKKRRGVW